MKRKHRPFPNKRSIKRRIKALASQLIPHVSYAWGCRGHPGLVIERCYWPDWSVQHLMGSDVTIKSLVDGVEESCSIYNCSPLPLSKEEAERKAERIRTVNSFDLYIEDYNYPLETVKKWYDDWAAEGSVYYVLHEQDGFTVRSSQVFNAADAQEKIDRLKKFEDKGISNPRTVEMSQYPVPIKSFPI